MKIPALIHTDLQSVIREVDCARSLYSDEPSIAADADARVPANVRIRKLK